MAYTKKPNNSRPSYNKPGQYNPRVPAMATAPYNFVSLPAKPLLHPMVEHIGTEVWRGFDKSACQKEYVNFVANDGAYTGYIDLTIKTAAPCFIGGELKNDTKQFFTTDGAPVIPGSSIRGMIKNIFKLITCGAMRPGEDFADKHLYFRKIMAATDNKNNDTLKTHYDELINRESGGTKPGFLIRTKGKGEYFVCPAVCDKPKEMEPVKPRDMGSIYFHVQDHSADCITGEINKKQHRHCVYGGNFSREARLPMQPELNVIENYEADRTRRGVNLLDARHSLRGGRAGGFTDQKDIDLVVPCFYTEKDGYVQNFGHGPHYRVPYITSISDHVPQDLQCKDIPIDFSDMVFGNMGYWSTRVFFDDAKPTAPDSVKRDMFDYTRPLMAPNPTSYQLYLQQDGSDVGKIHWDSPDAAIRGYKFYWHRFANAKDNSWMKTEDQKVVKGMTKIKPIKENSVFQGKIRFENLSKVELGALCAAVSFAREGHKTAYKIGMGKSIGMGSILLEPTLYIENMDRHYSRLFAGDNDGWMREVSERDMKEFVDSFAEYRGKHLSEETAAQLKKSLDELAELLDCAGKDDSEWLQKTSMMQIGKGDKRFINRIALLDAISFAKGRLK